MKSVISGDSFTLLWKLNLDLKLPYVKFGTEYSHYNGMSKKRNKCSQISCLELTLWVCTFLFLFVLHCRCLQANAILLTGSPATVKKFNLPYKSLYDLRYLNHQHQLKPSDPVPPKGPTIAIENYFRIEPADAIDGIKYSQPATDRHQVNSYPSMNVPSMRANNNIFSSENPSQSNFQKQILPLQENSTSKPPLNVQFLDSVIAKNLHFAESVLGSDFKVTDDELGIYQSDQIFSEDEDVSNSKFQGKNNFTNAGTNLLTVSSETILSYKNPSDDMNKDASKYIAPMKKSSERAIEDVPSHYSDTPKLSYSNFNFSTLSPDLVTPSSVVLSTHQYIEFINQTESVKNDATTIVSTSMHEVENISSSLPSFGDDIRKFSSGAVAGIVIGVLVCVTVLSSAVIYLLYRKYNGKCASVVEAKFNSDNCGYLDDSLRSSIYLNNHIELPKESSEEMSSLDNDSFLNSLETMTIQNYWADNSKNTKV